MAVEVWEGFWKGEETRSSIMPPSLLMWWQVKGEGRAVVVRGDKREVVKAASSGGEAWPKG